MSSVISVENLSKLYRLGEVPHETEAFHPFVYAYDRLSTLPLSCP